MEQSQITIVVAVIRNEKGEILLARRNEPKLLNAHDKWEFVGGGIDFGEDPIQALKREVKEEAGVEIEVIRLLPRVISDVETFEEGKQTHVIIISYECKIVSGELTPGLDNEIAELKFVPLREIPKYNTFRNIQETIDVLNSKD
jgi:8-oxo-dGTP diphosphatase